MKTAPPKSRVASKSKNKKADSAKLSLTPSRTLLIVDSKSQNEWISWLEKSHTVSPGVWLRMAKKDTGIPSVNYAEALEAALCYGWIDGQKDKFDHEYWLQRFTPRGPKSIWSKINCGKVEALIASGRMKPAGLLAVERAKQDGRWDAAYDSQSKAIVPADFQAELDKSKTATAFFITLNSANRYAILFRIQNAKKPETRARKIREFIDMLLRKETFHPLV